MLTKMIPTWSTEYALSQKNVQEIQIQWNQLPRLMWTLQCDVELKRMNVFVANGEKLLIRHRTTLENWQINTQNSHIRIWRNDWTLSWMRERTCRRKKSCRQFALIHSKVYIKTSWRLAVRESGNFRSSWNKKTEQVASEKTLFGNRAWMCLLFAFTPQFIFWKTQIDENNQKVRKHIQWSCWRWMPIQQPPWHILTMMFAQLFVLLCKELAWFQMITTPEQPEIHWFERSIQDHRKRNSTGSNHKTLMNDWLFSTRWENSQNHIQRSESIQQMQKMIFDYHKIRFDCDWRISWSIRQRPCTYSNHNHNNEWWTCGEIRTRNKTVRQNQSNWEIAKVVIRCSNQIVAVRAVIM